MVTDLSCVDSISVIGAGNLGAPIAACFATQGFRVTVVDVDQAKVDALNAGLAPVFEPGLPELLNAGRDRLTATGDVGAAVCRSDMSCIVVPTPSAASGRFSLQYLLPVCEAIGRALRAKSRFHVVVVVSTVMPGSMEGAVCAALETASGKRCGTDFGLCYNPQFIALGSVIQDLQNRDFTLIGESDPRSGDVLASVSQRITNREHPIARMSFINAEVAKLAVNTYVTMKISFANMLARICERLAGGNVDAVTTAVGMDSRIGAKYLHGAIGYGGPCFPRDNVALTVLAQSLGTPALLTEATDKFNKEQTDWLAVLVKSHLSRGGTAGILGMAYKADTDVVEESQGVLLARRLTREEIQVVAYDPVANVNAQREVGVQVLFVRSAKECIQRADVVVLATPWDEFRRLTSRELARHSHPRTVIDCWRVIEGRLSGDGVVYIPLGIGNANVRSP